jgi:single-stranded-DNA-specific exonuclease
MEALRTTRLRGESEWIIAPPHPDCDRLASEAGIAPLLAQVLLNRDISTAAQVVRFLSPDLKLLLPPQALPNAVLAARRLADAVRAGRRIVIYGDYDVDGITATTILWLALRLAGANVSFYIPSRLEEGYGVNGEALRSIAAGGDALVITVDCGITALAEAQLARQLGLDLIITDHHEPDATLPECGCVVHPSACGPSENPDLSGAGVALKIAWAFGQEFCGAQRVPEDFRDFLLEATAFAALGLVADVVPLTGENRAIAAFGLKHLRHTQNAGLLALLQVSGLEGKSRYDDYDVGFTLAPRLNAIGRLGHARMAVELFTTADANRAREIATILDAQNRKRQELERTITRQAEALVVERGFDRDGCHGIVLACEQWHAGVIGIVASRLVNRFRRPAVLIALENGCGQGSARSIPHFPLHEVLACCGQHLLSHGGHAMAAGVRLTADHVDAFSEAFLAEAGRRLTPKDLRPRLHLDDEVDLADLTIDIVETLQRMAPHGTGNPAPRLATPLLELAEPPRIVGKSGNHLQMTVRQGREYRKAIAFGRGEHAERVNEHRRLRLAFEPIINEWNGRRSVELKVVDWKLGEC